MFHWIITIFSRKSQSGIKVFKNEVFEFFYSADNTYNILYYILEKKWSYMDEKTAYKNGNSK